MRVWTALSWPGAKNGLLSCRWRALPISRDPVRGTIHLSLRNVSGQVVTAIALILVLLVTPTTALADQAWVSGWPPGQPSNEITALAIAADGKVIYASTPAALYRSTDGGASWKTASSTANIVALAIDSKNPDVIYVYLWPGPDRPGAPPEARGLRKSVDGGQTWSDPSGGALAESIGTAAPVRVLVIDPTNPQTLFAGTSNGARIYRSTDSGQTWQVTYAPNAMQPAGMVGIAVHPRHPNVVFAAHTFYHGGTLLFSHDGGLSWKPFANEPQLPLSGPAALALDPLDPNTISVAYQAPMGGGVRFFRASPIRPSTELSEGLPTDGTSGPRLAIDPYDQRVLYLSLQGDKGGVFQSMNGNYNSWASTRGNPWTRLSPEDDPRFGSVTALGYSATERMLYAGTKEGVWQREVLPAIADSLAEYYEGHDGWRVLGRPISAPIRVDGPTLRHFENQYFEKGRLEDHTLESDDPNWQFMYGLLADELQAVQVNLPVGGDTSTISYADIHLLASPDRRIPPPASFVSGVLQTADGSTFVPYDARLQRESGHNVPDVFWSYINRSDLFPSGWLHDVGLPMTEAVEAIVDKGEAKGRKITIQAFQRTVLTYDPLNPTEWQVERANIGADYLKAFPDKARP